MKRIRIGNNISVTWLLYESDGNVHNLEGKELELYMTCGGMKFVVADYTVTENAVAWTFPAQLQTRTGYYKLVLLDRDAQRGLYSFDVAQAFCLEPKDALTNIETIYDEDTSVQVKSVLTYAHITNLASVDTVESGDGYSAVIHLTNGKTFTIPIGSGGGGQQINVVDNLNSSSSTDALSAKQGRVLKGLIDAVNQVDVVDNLTSTSTDDALSANMGRELKRLIDSIEPGGGGDLPIASASRLGGIRVGSGLSINSTTGVLSVTGGGSGGGDSAKSAYSAVEENPGDPDNNPSNWHTTQTSSDVWMAISFYDGSSWSAWTLIYIGDIVAPFAYFKSSAFTRSNAASVSTPTGGSYQSPVPTTEGWEDGIPAGDGAIWMSTRTFASDNAHSDEAWSTPELIADNDYFDYEFSSAANPGEPAKTSPSAAQTNPNWSNTATTGTIWMAMRQVRNGAYAPNSSWMITKIKGENGADGTSVTIKGSVSSVGDLPSSDNEVGDGYILTTNGHLYVWDGDSWEDCGQIKGDDGDPGATPYIHIKYSNDGVNFTGNSGEEPGKYIGIYVDYNVSDSSTFSDYTWHYWQGQDGFGYEYIFKLTATSTAPDLPSTSTNVDDYVPTGWTDDPGGVTAEYPFCWVAWRKKSDGVWSQWYGTTGGKARLYAHYGADGPAGQAQFKSTVFKRSATRPDRPGNGTVKNSSATPLTSFVANPAYGGTFNDPVPYGWSDGVPALNTLSGPDDLSNTLWMTTRVFTDDGQSPQDENWATPAQAMDTDGWDFEYAYMQVNDARPADPTTANRHGGSGTQIWFDPIDDFYLSGTTPRDFTEMYWMAMRIKVNGVGQGTWTVLRIKGEKGTDGVDGKDGKPVRIRKWSDIAGQTLGGNLNVFSGYEDGAPFRDVIILTPGDYPNNVQYPFLEGSGTSATEVPALVTINYNTSYETGYPGSYFTGSTIPQEGNYTDTLPAGKSYSASAYLNGDIWAVFANMGAVYIQLLVATQAYIGALTVHHLTTSNGNNSSIEIEDGLIVFRDSDGKVRIVIGQGTNDDTPVLKFYDSDGTTSTLGTELYNLGPGGIMQATPVSLPNQIKYGTFYKATAYAANDFLSTKTFIYKYEDGYRILSSGGNTIMEYMDPYDINSYSSTHSSLNGTYFKNYTHNLTASWVSSNRAINGYYVSDPLLWSDDETISDQQYEGGEAVLWNSVPVFQLTSGAVVARWTAKVLEYGLPDDPTHYLKITQITSVS